MAAAFTSDTQARPNGLTREEWLRAVLYSGEVTRIAQHLALVIYHLADTTTQIAKLSARDLERITGWSRTAIIDHISELEVFVRVTWGKGRAKSIFELQGIIAQVLEEQKAANEVATTADKANTTSVDTTSSVNLPASPADTQAATNGSGNLPGHICGSQDDTTVQKPSEGGTIGGEPRNNPTQSQYTHTEARPAVAWVLPEEGGFEGRVFDLSPTEYDGLRQVYDLLEWPADMVAADQFFWREFDRKGISPTMEERNSKLHQYLARRNREVRELRLTLNIAAATKGTRKPAKPIQQEENPSCWFDPDGRLQVANGFGAEMLEVVSGDEIRLRKELDLAGPWVGTGTRGPQLCAKVRARLIEQVSGTRPGAQPQPSTRSRFRKHYEEIEQQKNLKGGLTQ
jgi:hypothetical protein